MTGRTTYQAAYKMCKRLFALLRITVCMPVALSFVTITAFGKEDPVYDEIPVYVTVSGVGSIEIPAVIQEEKAYISIAALFDFLKIKYTLSAEMDSVTGYFITPQTGFAIDYNNRRIIAGDKSAALTGGELIKTAAGLYLRSDYFEKLFGLNCAFNFRSLTIKLTTSHELPVIKEKRQETMRNNLLRLTGEIKTDTTINASRRLFRFGMADWSVITTRSNNGASNTRLNLALGTTLAGGEATVSLNYDSYAAFTEKQQFYQWRYVNNESRAVRQVMAGKISTQTASTIFSPIVGVQFTNTPTTARRSFGAYVLSDRTEPNWMVELYVNNALVSYVKADASGFFSFEIPLMYGNSSVRLRYYGPWGEERTSERQISIPFNFLPQGQFEYTVSAGMVEDSLRSRFSRAAFNYGLGKCITIGGGMEYLSSVTTGEQMPFANASLRLAPNLLVSTEYVYGVKSKQVLNYRLPSNLQFEFTYSRYRKGQKAINNTFLEERKAIVSYPFRCKNISLFSRLTMYQIVLPPSKNAQSSKYTNTEVLFSGVAFGVNMNLTTFALFTAANRPNVYSNFSSSFRLPAKMIFTPQVQYDYNNNKLISLKGEIGKYLSARGYANIFYENNQRSRFQSIGAGFRYDFSFAQMSLSARRGNRVNTTVQSARGSLIYDGATNYLALNNRTSVGKGGIIVLPYLDLNGNGIRDKNEPKAAGLKVQINTGRVRNNNRDTTLLITDLEANKDYIVTLNTAGFGNISWYVKNKVLRVAVSANQMRLLEIPVTVAGEVSGTVFRNDAGEKKGAGRIIVSIFDSAHQLVAQTLTEPDGYFSYFGLRPGAYTARVDKAQLKSLQLEATPEVIPFNIQISNEGGVVDGLEFELR